MAIAEKDIFKERVSLQPYQYPHLEEYVSAMHESFWTPEHFQYDRDVFDFKTKLSPNEQQIVKRCMLAIGIVENKVKTFWGRLDMRMPNPETADVGQTFSANEVVHKMCYERLLNLLGLGKSFESVMEVPCMKDRTAYLKKYVNGVNSRSNREFTKSLMLFTLLIENVSLFSQFLVVSSFNKYKNLLTNFNSVVTSTSKDENIHGQFGAELIKVIREENPDWFDDEMEAKIRRSVRKAYKAELGVLDWIFEGGELEFLSKDNIIEYLKSRFNLSLKQIGYGPEYDVDDSLLAPTKYFDVMTKCSIAFDFFDSSSGDYSEANMVTEDDW